MRTETITVAAGAILPAVTILCLIMPAIAADIPRKGPAKPTIADRCAKVEQEQVAMLQAARAGDTVGRGRVGATLHERRKGHPLAADPEQMHH